MLGRYPDESNAISHEATLFPFPVFDLPLISSAGLPGNNSPTTSSPRHGLQTGGPGIVHSALLAVGSS